jgi:hypothetical protein
MRQANGTSTRLNSTASIHPLESNAARLMRRSEMQRLWQQRRMHA